MIVQLKGNQLPTYILLFILPISDLVKLHVIIRQLYNNCRRKITKYYLAVRLSNNIFHKNRKWIKYPSQFFLVFKFQTQTNLNYLIRDYQYCSAFILSKLFLCCLNMRCKECIIYANNIWFLNQYMRSLTASYDE